jgi:hypothetical protein
MKEKMLHLAAGIAAGIDRRDLVAAGGLGLIGYGGEIIYPGAGFAAVGAVMVAVAVLVR